MNGGLRVVFANRHQVSILLLDSDAGGKLRIQLALGPLHGNRAALDFDRNSLGERDRLSSNS
jgi:hypothetical protein